MGNLEAAFTTWNNKIAEIWQLVTQSPEQFKGGTVWAVMVSISDGLRAIAYGLLVLFFAMGIFQTVSSFKEVQRPETALRFFIRFACAKVGVSRAMEIMTVIFAICGGAVQSAMGHAGSMTSGIVSLPAEIETAVENVGFLYSIPLWIVTFLGSLFITVMSFILILTVYGRFFKIYMYTAASPLAISTFAGETTAHHGAAFLKGYVSVCMEGLIIVLACLIFSGFVGSGTPTLDTSLNTVTMIWSYLVETIFNMFVLVGLIKGADRVAKEMFGL